MNWNNSSQQLPSFYESVLVVIDQGKGPFVAIGQRKQYPQQWDVYGYGTFLKDDIDYWQPLPELPQVPVLSPEVTAQCNSYFLAEGQGGRISNDL